MRRLVALCMLGLLAPLAAAEDEPADLLASGDVFVEAEVQPAEGAVAGQRISLLVHIGTTTWFAGAPDLPDVDVEGAIVRRFGTQAVNASDTRDDRTYAMQTWTWWIYPRRAGRFEIPALDVLLRTVDEDRKNVEVRARTKPLAFEVSTPPDATDEAVLAARDVRIGQALEPGPEGLKVGDALRRTITVRADDVPGMLLPPVDLGAAEGLRPYADAPLVDDAYERGALEGRRVQSTSWILEREGAYTLPEVRVRWWNLETKAWAEAVAEAVVFEVAPNPDAVLGGASDAEGIVDRRTPSWSSETWGALLAALVAAILLGRWVARRMPGWKQAWDAARAQRAASEPVAFERFEAACRTGGAKQVRDALRTWLDRAVGPAVTVEAFVRADGDPTLARTVAALGRALYGGTGATWSARELHEAVAGARERVRAAPRAARTVRRSLNPRSAPARP